MPFRRVHFAAGKKCERVLPSPEPIHDLAPIRGDGNLHLAEEFLDELRPELRIVIEKAHVVARAAGQARIVGGDIAFPFGVREIPERAQLVPPDKLRVIDHDIVDDGARAKKHVLTFAVGKMKFLLEPKGFIRDFRKDQGRTNRIERFSREQNLGW